VSLVFFIALIIQLIRSRRKWKRLAVTLQSDNVNNNNTTTTASAYPRPRYTIVMFVLVAVFFYLLTFNLGKAFESKKNKSISSKSGLDSERLSRLVLVFGKYELDETTFYVLICTSMVLFVALGVQIGVLCRKLKETQKKHSTTIPTRQSDVKSLDVVIIGCAPKSVGWFHLIQFLDMQNINVTVVVDEQYMDSPIPPQPFIDLTGMLREMDIECVSSIKQLGIFKQQTLCVIAGKPVDNPRLFRECISIGASHIYLEPPGAPNVQQLKDMSSLATTRGVRVYMGYQRTCANYIEQALNLSKSIPKSHIFFCHNETYSSNDLQLSEEGMVYSIQELAVLVTQIGINVEEIVNFKVNTNKLFSEKQIFHDTTSGDKIYNLSRVAFKITTSNKKIASVMVDRCGGLLSFAVVKSKLGKELQRFQSLDTTQVKHLTSELRDASKQLPRQCMIESDDFLELKRRVVKSILSESNIRGLVSIKEGVQIMMLADYCKKEIDTVLPNPVDEED